MTNSSKMPITLSGTKLQGYVTPEGSIRVSVEDVHIPGIYSKDTIRDKHQTYTIFCDGMFVESVSLASAMEVLEYA